MFCHAEGKLWQELGGSVLNSPPLLNYFIDISGKFICQESVRDEGVVLVLRTIVLCISEAPNLS